MDEYLNELVRQARFSEIDKLAQDASKIACKTAPCGICGSRGLGNTEYQGEVYCKEHRDVIVPMIKAFGNTDVGRGIIICARSLYERGLLKEVEDGRILELYNRQFDGQDN